MTNGEGSICKESKALTDQRCISGSELCQGLGCIAVTSTVTLIVLDMRSSDTYNVPTCEPSGGQQEVVHDRIDSS